MKKTDRRLKLMQDIDKKHGGKCLSRTYASSRTALEFKCDKDEHPSWFATPENITGNRSKRGTWCRVCGNEKNTLAQLGSFDDFMNIVLQKRGRCLSTVYRGNHRPLDFICALGHTWRAAPSSIKGGSWCRKCSMAAAGKKQRLDIRDLQKLARSRGGELISKEYLRNSEKLQWSCGIHTWFAPAARVKAGGWCPKCNHSVGERVCRTYFEAIFREPFPPVYKRDLAWLKHHEDHSMELDGYSSKLRLAFEHQGKQHYQSNRLGMSRKDHRALLMRDQRKRELCEQNDIRLIEIPEVGALTHVDELRTLIVKLCTEKAVEVPSDWRTAVVDVKAIYSPRQKTLLAEYQAIAKSRGGKFLAKEIVNVNTHVGWECALKHKWQARPINIKGNNGKKGTWCPQCGINRRADVCRHSIEMCKAFAISKGGACLSQVHLNGRQELLWQCNKKHRWKQSFEIVKGSKSKQGTWCPTCYRLRRADVLRRSLKEIQVIAKRKNIFCLSDRYTNIRTKLEFMCKSKHTWFAMPYNVKRAGLKCPFCR